MLLTIFLLAAALMILATSAVIYRQKNRLAKQPPERLHPHIVRTAQTPTDNRHCEEQVQEVKDEPARLETQLRQGAYETELTEEVEQQPVSKHYEGAESAEEYLSQEQLPKAEPEPTSSGGEANLVLPGERAQEEYAERQVGDDKLSIAEDPQQLQEPKKCKDKEGGSDAGTLPKEERPPQRADHPESPKSKTTGELLEPIKRGGRPRDSTVNREEPSSQEAKVLRPKLDIVCWERERQWIPALEVPEDLFENPGLTVFQNASLLKQDDNMERFWPLEEAFGEIAVQWTDEESVREMKITIGEDNCLLFRLSGQRPQQGTAC